MNKILVNKNKIEDYRDDFIKIVDGNIYLHGDLSENTLNAVPNLKIGE